MICRAASRKPSSSFATTATLLAEGRRALPELSDRLARIAPYAGTEREGWAVREAYALAPTANFSRAILQTSPARLAVSRLPRLTWSDWGTPDRVLRSLASAGISPPWLREVTRARETADVGLVIAESSLAF